MDIIILEDGTLVEVDSETTHEIGVKRNVKAQLVEVKQFLEKAVGPVVNSLKEVASTTNVEETKLTIGIKVGAQGNFILAKSSVDAHIKIEMKLGK